MVRFIGIIPARGGSKGIKRKNIIDLCGKPLIEYTISAAKKSKLDDFYVSTEDEEIKKISESLGSKTIERSFDLSSDTAKTFDVIMEAKKKLGLKNEDYIILLQPTTPLRTPEDINSCIEIAIGKKASCVVSFYKAESEHPYYMYLLEEGRLTELIKNKKMSIRQEYPSILVRNGAIYLIKVKDLINSQKIMQKKFEAYVMPKTHSINIDNLEDFKLVKGILMLENENTNN